MYLPQLHGSNAEYNADQLNVTLKVRKSQHCIVYFGQIGDVKIFVKFVIFQCFKENSTLLNINDCKKDLIRYIPSQEMV